MMALTATLKRVLSPSLQKQYKAGFRNGDLALTQRGKDELLELLAVDKEKELTAAAVEFIEANEEVK